VTDGDQEPVATASPALPASLADPAEVRRRLLVDGFGIAVSAAAFAAVFGLAARQAGFSLLEAMSQSLFVFAGAAQFAAVGLVAQGVPWLGIVVLTAALNSRHALYSAALAPWFVGSSRRQRAAAAFVLTDECFALALPAFRRLGRLDLPTYAIAALAVWLPWEAASAVGYLGGQLLPDPRALGIDVVFPAAMAGLAVALVVDSRSLAAAVIGAGVGLGVALAVQPSVGVIIGGLAGPGVAMLLVRPTGSAAETREDAPDGWLL
jgi:predicted branched-subunit amino acid permease